MGDHEAERLHEAIGQRIRELRLAKGAVSQEALAARAGLHRTFVGKLERGETATTVDSLATLCAALDTTLADFFAPFDKPPKLRGPRRRR